MGVHVICVNRDDSPYATDEENQCYLLRSEIESRWSEVLAEKAKQDARLEPDE